MRLETTVNRALTTTAEFRVVDQHWRPAARFHAERRARHDFVRVEPAFHDEPAGDVPVKRSDMSLALR